jgi:hypothetical protein
MRSRKNLDLCYLIFVIKNLRARLKVFSSWSSAPVAYSQIRTNIPKFKNTAWWCTNDQEFYADDEKTHGPRFWTSSLDCSMAMIRPKSQNSIKKAWLCSFNQKFCIAWGPTNNCKFTSILGNWPTTKNVFPVSVVHRICYLLEHIFKKMRSTGNRFVVRPSIRLWPIAISRPV